MKNNKGITLIALVVTIIILLILAGVSITTLSGNGLFGRAESSAAKYQAASEAENSTISSILDKYDYYENKVSQGVTITWRSALADRGSFINSLTPTDPVSSNYESKQMVIIKPDGTKQLLNPYQAGSVSVPQGTKLRMYTYSDPNYEITDLGFFDDDRAIASVKNFDKDGGLMYAEMTITKDLYLYMEDDDQSVFSDVPDNPEDIRGKTVTSWVIYVAYNEQAQLEK